MTRLTTLKLLTFILPTLTCDHQDGYELEVLGRNLMPRAQHYTHL